MKKVININFQGRVIPIEESAYDMLKQYVESLRRFFANEEGRDEIINDIEGRIAELFGESLKKGSTCITEDDVNKVIAGMGRPEDFEGEEGKVHSQLGGDEHNQQHTDASDNAPPRGRLYRDESDKILGGVCGGLANYLRVDPTIIRLVFALITFGAGTGILLYILLWIILPSKSLQQTSSTKRLYRNPEQKVIAGVASGIASYFDIAIWIPRLIFAFPLVIGIITSIFKSAFWFDVDPFPGIIFGSFGGTLFVVYAVLWAVIPEAKSASEKLEMRGEKVDLNTIKNTIQEDLEGFKTRAEKWGGEFSNKAKEFGEEFGQTVGQKSRQFGTEAGHIAQSGGSRVLRAIGIMFKAFFLFIAGILAFTLLVALLAFLVAGVGVFPLKNFFLEGFWQNLLAWTTLALFLGIPVIAFITWIVRRIMGVKSGNRYLGFTFGGLWFIGLVSAGILAGSIAQNFDARARDKKEYTIAQPVTGKMVVKVPESKVKVYGRWFKIKMGGILQMNDDSLVLNNVKLHIAKSTDSLYHISAYKYSNGADEKTAVKNVDDIQYGINQQDSLIYLDRGFSLKNGARFRNQSVTVTIQVPVGKKIVITNSVNRQLTYAFHFGNRNNDWDFEEDWNSRYENWISDVEYIMTPGGLEKLHKSSNDYGNDDNQNNAIEQYKKSKEELQKEYDKKWKEAEELKKELDKPVDSTKYQYKKSVSYIHAPKLMKGKETKKAVAAEETRPSVETSRIAFMQMIV